jgi:hypothetical protein
MGNPGAFIELLSNRPAGLLAHTVVLPALKPWLEAKERELAEIDAEIAKLAADASKKG